VLCETDRVPVLGKPITLFQSMNGERLNMDDYYDYDDESKTTISIIRIMKNLKNFENLRDQ
jgi:glutaredoxin-related protein